jgi:hypothetical protein
LGIEKEWERRFDLEIGFLLGMFLVEGADWTTDNAVPATAALVVAFLCQPLLQGL